MRGRNYSHGKQSQYKSTKDYVTGIRGYMKQSREALTEGNLRDSDVYFNRANQLLGKGMTEKTIKPNTKFLKSMRALRNDIEKRKSR
jgi:ribosomal protein S20